MSSRKRWLRVLAALFAFSLLAAACGDSDDGDDSADDAGTEAAAEDDQAAAEEEDDEAEGGVVSDEDIEEALEDDEAEADDEPMAEPQTFEELEDRWAADRAAMVADLTAGLESGDYGVGDDNVLRGPGGFEADLSECPEDWDDSGGVSDTAVRVGQSWVRSGAAAAYVNWSFGFEEWFQYINETGGVGGRDIEFITKDDGYVAAQTIENVDELIQAEDVFLIHTGGSPNTLAVYDTINDECIPHPFAGTGHPAWGDPVNHPWTTGGLFPYASEAVLWGNWIKDNVEDLPAVVGGIVVDNDFGLAYEEGFRAWAEENPDVVEEFVAIRHDPAIVTTTNEVTTVAASNPDVIIAMTLGAACTSVMDEVDRQDIRDTLVAAWMPSVCKDVEGWMVPAGEAADGWFIAGGGMMDPSDPTYADQPFIAWFNERMAAEGYDTALGLIAQGMFLSFPMVEAMKVADELPGGLTRTNFLLALRGLNTHNAMSIPGLKYQANGFEDAYYPEGTEIAVFDATEKSWGLLDLIDLNGLTPNCAFDKDTGACA